MSVSKGEVTCTLDQQRPYDLARAYERAPYIELGNLQCANELSGQSRLIRESIAATSVRTELPTGLAQKEKKGE